jgi:RNA polymerase sigma factor (sigma-70 family)
MAAPLDPTDRDDPGFVARFADLHRVAYRAAFVVLGDRSAAEDAAQEALARCLVRWRRVSGHAEPWVARVATNLALDAVRRARRRPPSLDADRPFDPAASRRLDLARALEELPRRQREVVVLRFVADLPEQQTADAMRCSVGTVKSATSRALDRLARTLGPTWALED